MRIGITGTPGTGKTSVGEKLSELIGLPVYSVNELAAEHDLELGEDHGRNAAVIDEEKLGQLDLPEHGIFEGHLAHYLSNLDALVILRCHPEELEVRLAGKGWSDDKIAENVEAEGLDIVLQEALQQYDELDIREINTTENTVRETAETIKDLLNGEEDDKQYMPGGIHFTSDVV